jgi:Initiator Replication protein
MSLKANPPPSALDQDLALGPDAFKTPVSALAMVPKTGAITRIGRLAYATLMMSAREQVEERDGFFSAPLNTILRGFDGAGGTARELKDHLRSMVTHVVEWQSPSPAETVEWGACALLSEVRLSKKNGENWISWAYPPSLRTEVLDPQRYGLGLRSTMVQFRTNAGLALYNICARYKDNPSHLTSKQHWHWWLPVLTGKPTPEEIRTEFRFFNRDVVKPAVAEVNEVSELIVTVREIKVGRSIEFLQFEVRKRQAPASVVQYKIEPIDMSSVIRAQQLGIDFELAEELFLKHGIPIFAAAVVKLEARLNSNAIPLMYPQAYLKTILNGRAFEQPTKEEVALHVVQTSEPSANALRHEKLLADENVRVVLVRSEIEALDQPSLDALLVGLKIHLQNTNAPAAYMKRLDEGKWQSSLIMGLLIRHYWEQTRGTAWSTPSDSLPVNAAEQEVLF